MSKIDKLIQQYCPDGVEFKTLGELCEIKTGKMNANAMDENGKYPFFTCDAKPYRINEYAFDTSAILVSGNGSQVGHLNTYEGKFNAYQRTYVLDKFVHVTKKYLFHYMRAFIRPYVITNSRKGSVPYITLPMLKNFPIPLPPLPVQEEIVRILDKFTELETELEAELEARKKQYEFYRDKLLNFNKLDIFNGGGYKLIMLKDLAVISTGNHNTVDAVIGGTYNFYVRSPEIFRMNSYDYDEEAVITSGDGAGVGKIVHHVNGKYALHQRAYRIHPIDASLITGRYIYHYMKATFYNYIMGNAVNSSVTSVRRPMLEKYPIPVVSINEQKRITKILDQFDALINDLSVGLPAEIAARRQQYEYYREQLLSFKRKGGVM